MNNGYKDPEYNKKYYQEHKAEIAAKRKERQKQAKYKEYKHKGWIIGLALCCFVPFGTILYLISLIWSIILLFRPKQQIKRTK